MTKLYELADQYANWEAMLEYCETPEEEAEILESLEAINASIAEKAEAYARLIRNFSADIDAYGKEIARFQKMKKAKENAIDRMKNNLVFSMKLYGADALNTSIGKWRIQKNPPKVQITKSDEVPIEFTEEQPRKIMNSLILKHWKETGEIPEGCDIVIAEGVRFK